MMRAGLLCAVAAALSGLWSPAAAACGWVYPRDLPLVETNVLYWRLPLAVPPGGAVEIAGRFAYARQMSFNIHSGVDSRLLGGLSDVELTPIKGHSNPFVEGARRRAGARTYRVVIAGERLTRADQAGSARAGDTGAMPLRILYRIYLPDRDKPGGGVDLPTVTVLDRDGRRTVVAGRGCPDPGGVDTAQARGPTAIPPGPSRPAMPLDWRNAVVRADSATGDVFVNRDNSYAYALTDIPPGQVLVLSGLSPSFPRTRDGVRRLGGGDVRYWSLCAYRHPSDRSASCLADEDMVRKDDATYVVAVGALADRPADAAHRCRGSWLAAPGPGAGAVFLRHVGARADFAFTPQKGEADAPSATVMGPYLPASQQMPAVDYEKQYCRVERPADLPRR